MGDRKKLSLGITQDLYITIPQGQYKSLDAKMNIEKRITAPITKGHNYGQLVVKLNDELITEVPLIALEDVKPGTIWERISDYFSLGLHKALNSEDSQSEATT
jgi:D-alanyl-D-alanine carboxypeptidase (penicillin-binding protein 5/6)